MAARNRFRREILSWFDEKGDRYLTTDEQADIESQRANFEQQRANAENQKVQSERQRADAAEKQVELLLAKLRSLGIAEE